MTLGVRKGLFFCDIARSLASVTDTWWSISSFCSMSTIRETTPIESITAPGPMMGVSATTAAASPPDCSTASRRQPSTTSRAFSRSIIASFSLSTPPGQRHGLRPRHQGLWWDILGDRDTGSDHGAGADRHSGEDRTPRAYPSTIANGDRRRAAHAFLAGRLAGQEPDVVSDRHVVADGDRGREVEEAAEVEAAEAAYPQASGDVAGPDERGVSPKIGAAADAYAACLQRRDAQPVEHVGGHQREEQVREPEAAMECAPRWDGNRLSRGCLGRMRHQRKMTREPPHVTC